MCPVYSASEYVRCGQRVSRAEASCPFVPLSLLLDVIFSGLVQTPCFASSGQRCAPWDSLRQPQPVPRQMDIGDNTAVLCILSQYLSREKLGLLLNSLAIVISASVTTGTSKQFDVHVMCTDSHCYSSCSDVFRTVLGRYRSCREWQRVAVSGSLLLLASDNAFSSADEVWYTFALTANSLSSEQNSSGVCEDNETAIAPLTAFVRNITRDPSGNRNVHKVLCIWQSNAERREL
jgi:hypothetical protein